MYGARSFKGRFNPDFSFLIPLRPSRSCLTLNVYQRQRSIPAVRYLLTGGLPVSLRPRGQAIFHHRSGTRTSPEFVQPFQHYFSVRHD